MTHPPEPSANASNVDTLCDSQSVIEFDAKISDGAIHFGVTEQELNRPEITGLPINQRSLGPP